MDPKVIEELHVLERIRGIMRRYQQELRKNGHKDDDAAQKQYRLVIQQNIQLWQKHFA